MLINTIAGLTMGLIVLAPIVLVIVLGQRLGWRPRWIAAGAVTFIGSRMIHLPLNWVLGQIGLIPSATPVSVQTALVLGLTAGVCEELARAAALTWWVSEVRDGNKSAAFGLGHGGIEAVIIGILGGFSIINMIALQTMDLGALGLEPEQLEQVKAQVAAFANQPAWQPVIPAWERAMAMINHLFMTTLVMTGLMKREWGWIAGAIAWHTAINAIAVWLHQHHGILAAEGALTAMTVAAAALWWRQVGADLKSARG